MDNAGAKKEMNLKPLGKSKNLGTKMAIAPESFVGHGRSGKIYRNILRWGLLLQIYLAPLPLASNRPIFWLFWAALNGILLVVWSCGILPKKKAPPIGLRQVWFAVFVFAPLIIWPILQTQISRTDAHPWWYILSATLNTETLLQKISASPHESILGSIRYASYAIAFWIALQVTGSRRSSSQNIFKHILFSALLYAAYSIVTYGLSSEKLFFYPHSVYSSSVSGTYVNRNHYAGHLGVAIILTLGFFFHALRREILKNAKSATNTPDLIKRIFTKLSYYTLALAVLMAALLLTFSRAGLSTTVLGIAIFLLSILFVKDLRPIRKILFALNAVIVLLVFFLIQTGGHSTFERMLNTEEDLSSRNVFYKTTMNAIKDGNSLHGTGLGSFEYVYSGYMKPENMIMARVDHAHNTYIENVLELGWPAYGISLIGMAVFFSYAAMVAITNNNRKIYAITALALITQTGSHAMLDYSYEIPAFSLTMSIIMGAILSEFINRKRHRPV